MKTAWKRGSTPALGAVQSTSTLTSQWQRKTRHHAIAARNGTNTYADTHTNRTSCTASAVDALLLCCTRCCSCDCCCLCQINATVCLCMVYIFCRQIARIWLHQRLQAGRVILVCGEPQRAHSLSVKYTLFVATLTTANLICVRFCCLNAKRAVFCEGNFS